ncbi:tRNA (adenosine(37)-N6)-threonylcarbamoyltransferase complex transferase subunit TsaD [Candidatus Roizmanbacteria bacterium]|nr:MAG: tRNA (adenosine(37)-N6)-threonylcarbamoyltransferase complex transferase subunit TsaD [Candidatus Roizmanbacteria bacterium]
MSKTVLAIDTSCDETAAAVVSGRRVLSNVIYSQVLMHKEWGGVVPSIARRAHEERIGWVVDEAVRKSKLQMSDVDAVAVTYGPGLAIALEVGIRYALELSKKYNKPIVRVNHMEGHLYSPFVQNSKGNPNRDFKFPYLGLLVSGGHTELVLFKDHLTYTILGETVDDAAGEALDKAARMLGFGYPGGPVIERLAKQVENTDKYVFPRPMMKSGGLNFSFSGLKTALLYKIRKMDDTEKNKEIAYLASSFQEAVFRTLIKKTERAMAETGINRLLVGGGVAVNQYLRQLMRELAKKHGGSAYFPALKYLNYDNAAMIGIVGAMRAEKGIFVENEQELDRVPRLSLLQSSL